MTEKSYLWTTGGAGDGASTYTRADWLKIGQVLAGCRNHQGVVPELLNKLVGSVPSANTARIGTGGAVVDGKPYTNSAAVNVTIPSAVGAGNTRIDRIVLRASWSAQTVRITRIAGTDAVNPAAPAITETSETTFDILLYQALVDVGGTVTLTDERDFAEISDGMVVTAMLADDAVTAAKIAAGAVGATEIANGAVGTTQIADGAVTAGKLAQPKPYSCRAKRTTDQTSVDDVIALTAEDFDSDAMHSNSTNNSRIICKRAGRYLVCGYAEVTGTFSTSLGQRYLQILLNGGTSLAIQDGGLMSKNFNVCAYITLALNDYVELYYGSTQSDTITSASLSLVWDG